MHNKLLHKTTRVLKAIDEHQALGLEELYLLLGLPKPTLKRLLDDLEEMGWLYRRLGDKRYVSLTNIHGPGDSHHHLAKEAHPFLDQLFESTGLASDLVIATASGPSILESNFSRLGIRTGRDRLIGARPCPLHAASGRALCAHQLLNGTSSWLAPGLRDNQFQDKQLQDKQLQGDQLRRLADEYRVGYFRRLSGNWEYGFRFPFKIDAIAIALSIKQRTMASLNLYWDNRRLTYKTVEKRYLSRLEAIGQQLMPVLERHAATLETLSQHDLVSGPGMPASTTFQPAFSQPTGGVAASTAKPVHRHAQSSEP
uniref:helix-turn-helix domain-containing protein n=1 Tax=Halomonas sp. TaxID=1486246 RepID=UPI002634A7A4|nr:helix-turn-helix domain-containing protein [Halomonas sp.]